MTTTQPIAGNQSFTNVVNLAGQVPNLDVADLEAVSADIESLVVPGSIIVQGEIVCGELDVQGQSLLQGEVKMDSNAIVQGLLTAGEVETGALAVTGLAVVNGDVQMDSNAVVLGQLSATDVAVTGTVTVAGDATFDQSVTVGTDCGITGGLKVSGTNISFGGLPNAAPANPGFLWNNAGVINIS